MKQEVSNCHFIRSREYKVVGSFFQPGSANHAKASYIHIKLLFSFLSSELFDLQFLDVCRQGSHWGIESWVQGTAWALWINLLIDLNHIKET